jgi:DNA-damage-inducible protein J
MAETTNLNIRIDKDLKERAEVFFADLGMNMTTAFNIFVRQSLKQGKIPFEILGNADPFYSAANMRVLEQSAHELREGKVVVKTLDELRAME